MSQKERKQTSETVGKTFSIINDPIFNGANKSLNVKLKKIKECGTSKVKHPSSIAPEDIQKGSGVVFLVMTRLYRC